MDYMALNWSAYMHSNFLLSFVGQPRLLIACHQYIIKYHYRENHYLKGNLLDYNVIQIAVSSR